MSRSLEALIIDDNSHMCFLLTEILRGMNVRHIRAVPDLTAAYHELSFKQFDFALVDVALEKENGLDFIRTVRLDRRSRHRQMPMLVVSGQGQQPTIEAARDAGADGFLIKPLSRGALETKVRQLLSRPSRYVEAPEYYGPDRRRHADPSYRGRERRADEFIELE